MVEHANGTCILMTHSGNLDSLWKPLESRYMSGYMSNNTRSFSCMKTKACSPFTLAPVARISRRLQISRTGKQRDADELVQCHKLHI
jgi:hypothetical protein